MGWHGGALQPRKGVAARRSSARGNLVKFGSLSVTTTDGRTRDYPVDLPSLVIGRADGNSIVIDDLSVARRHARVLIDSGRLMVEDFGSATGTFVGGTRIPPNTLSLVGEGDEIRFGDVAVHFRSADQVHADADAEPAEGETSLAPAVAAAPPAGLPGALRVVLSVPPHAVEPGGTALPAELIVHNRGRVVDELIVTVNDLPAEWVSLGSPRMILRPNEQATMAINIAPPRRSDSRAGTYDFSVTVTSRETGRQAVVNGSLTVLAFEGTELELQPARAKRDFRLVAANHGNALATYALSGTDDEDAFTFEFEKPALELPAGQSASLPFKVKNRKRALFGPRTAQPFTVVATPTVQGPEKTVARGQLVVAPPLEPLKRPTMFMALLMIVGIAALGFLMRPSQQEAKAAGTEEAYAGVHLCDKDGKPTDAVKQAEAAASATTTSSGGQIPKGSTSSGGPYFAQNDPKWANDEYAKAKDPDFGPDWCGTTIAQCGCAMTSVTTVMALYNILQMPDGSDLTPESVNNWFNGNARKTTRGWVSQGYIYGDVIWTAANQLSGEIAKIRPGTPTIKFSRTGTGSDDEIRTELKAGRPVVLEVPGHWIAAVGLDGNKILINDPFYRDRKTLDAYAGKVKSSVLFERSDDLSAVVITVPADERVRVTDKSGRVVGSLNTGSAEDAKNDAKVDIPGASYTNRQAWRDPTCIASAPPPGAGTNQIVLPGSAADYKIEVLDASGGNASVAIHTYGKDGTPSVKTIDNAGSVVAAVGYDPNKSAPDVKVLDEKPQTDASSDRAAGAKPSASPSPTATATATVPAATPTPGPVTTILSVSVTAGAKVVNIGSNFGFGLGDTIRFSPGAANEEDNTIVGFGSFILAAPLKFAHSAGEPIMRIAGSPGGGAPPPAPLPEIQPPEGVHLSCSPIYSTQPRNATLICTANITGTFTTTRWSIDGRVQSQFTGQTVMLAVFTQDATTAISVSACNVTVCASDAGTQAVRFPLSGNATPGATTTPTATPTPPPPPPPATGVAASCTLTLDTSPQALVSCEPLTRQAFSSITWSAPGLTPNVQRPSPDGAPFKAAAKPGDLTPDKNGNAAVLVTATLCGPGTTGATGACTVSAPTTVTIPYATTTLSVLPSTVLPFGNTASFFAVIKGPVAPNGGTVRFVVVDSAGLEQPIGLDQKVQLFPGFAFAQLNVPTGTAPFDSPNKHYDVRAIYSGSTNIFGQPSSTVGLDIGSKIEDTCNSLDDNANGVVDEDCVLPDSGTGQVDVGSGTILRGIDVNGAGNSFVATPGQDLILSTGLSRKSSPAGTDLYCANCDRQVYFGIGANAAVSPPLAASGPVCVSKNLNANDETVTPLSITVSGLKAPTTPGLYYLRVTGSLQSGCGQPDVGGPNTSVARIIVEGTSKTDLPATLPNTKLGDHVKVTARITSPGATGQPTGEVQFCDDSITWVAPTLPNDPLKCVTGTGIELQKVPVINDPSAPPNSTPGRVAMLDLDTTFLYAPSWSQSPAGTDHSISAHFLDEANGVPNPYYSPSDSAPATLHVDPAATSVELTPSNRSPKLGEIVMLNAAVRASSSFGAFGGKVEFYDGITKLGEADVSGTEIGVAAFGYNTGDATKGIYALHPTDATNQTTGHGITAKYVGAGNYSDGTSASVALKANPAATTLTLGSVPSSVVLGAPLTLTATLAPANFGSVLGTVKFYTSTTSTCNNTSPALPAPSLDTTTGVATLDFDTTALYSATTSPNPPGTHWFCAEYSGGGNYAGTATQGTAWTNITQAPVTVTLDDPTPPTLALGASLTLVAHVNSPKDFGTMGGTVEFRSGGTLLGTGAVGTDGNASCPSTGPGMCDTTAFAASAGAVGTHQVFARFLGHNNYGAADSGTKPLEVTAANTTVARTIPGTAQLGATTTLTATVTSTGSYGPFSGTVDFKDGGTVIASGSVSSSGAVSALVDWTKLPGTPGSRVGSHTIIASYGGGGNYGAQDSASATMNVTGAALTLILSTDKSAATAGETVTFTASASGSFGTPGGTVTLKNGTTTVGTGTLDGTGVATIGVTAGSPGLDLGSNTISAAIPATGDYDQKTSNNVTVAVQKSTVTVVTAPTGTLKVGTSLAFVVTVTCPSCTSGPNPAGTVKLFEGSTELDSASLSGGSKTLHATFPAPPGTHTLFARYGGSASFAASDSLPITITVQADTTTTLAAVTSPVVAGLNQTFTATVTAGATGTVDFKDSGTTIGSGTIAGGTATFSTTALTAGSHSITAVYNGDTLYLTSTSSPAQSVTVMAKAPTTLVVSAPGSAVHDTSVTFTAQVTCSSACTGAGAFAGTVTFTDGATTLGTAPVQADGSASLPLAAGITATGNHTIKASYVGTGSNYAGSSDTTGAVINIT